MVAFPIMLEKKVPVARHDRRIAKFLAGIGIAVIEAFILCPVERLKVYLMTHSQQI